MNGDDFPLRNLRKDAKLTRGRLAFLLDVDPMTIWRWETGKTEPSASMVSKLAWALRVPESDILKAVVGAKQAS